ncbi:protein-tyrosine phosphatase family protein, partial [Salmonella enterica]|uniref:phosphatase domain-containing protein n=3 Tax=Salmonella TaxID=590 RepID=UPI0023AF6351
KMPAFEWVHVQLHQQKGMISLSPPTICNSAKNSNQNGAPGRSSSDKHLPMIHCLGGVGRTGTMAAALVLKDNPHSNLEQVRADFRDSRNNRMLEDASQFVQLKAMQAQLLMTTAS